MESLEAFRVLGLSLGLGLLVGVQRQWSGSKVAGIRTFPIAALAGTLSAVLGREFGQPAWIVAAGILAIGAISIAGEVIEARASPPPRPGITTPVALIAMFLVGALAAVGPAAAVIAVGVAIAILLQLKGPLHGLAAKLGEKDLRAFMLFAAITFVILPILPDRILFQERLGDLAVWNPHEIWLMVVLIVGLSIAGYIGAKIVGPGAGDILLGLLGGLVSSTATTFAASRRARAGGEGAARPAALIVTLASGVVYIRVLVLLAIFAPDLIRTSLPPIAILLAISAVFAAVGAANNRAPHDDLAGIGNPSELRSALVFAVLYALVLFAVAGANRALGDPGLYIVAAISGLTDMDAITLSTARHWGEDGFPASTAWRLIVLAACANMAFKSAIVGVIGGWRPLRILLPYALSIIVAAIALILLWP